MPDLTDILLQSADEIINQIDKRGALPAGHNGPWENNQKPTRNTGHWTITFIYCYERTGKKKYLNAAQRTLSYLMSDAVRPYNHAFHHLCGDKSLRCNGLVGQAWSIETLAKSAKSLNRPELIKIAEKVFLQHPFDDQLCAWKYLDIDGEVQGIDMTFNHQLWFAMSGAILSEHSDSSDTVRKQVQQFLDALRKNVNIYNSGLIYHYFKPDFNFVTYTKIFIDGIHSGTANKMIAGVLRSGNDSDPMKEISIGYHTFNMYAFAVLKQYYPNHHFWNHEKFEKALEFCLSSEYKSLLVGNSYGYPYNCAGIEMAYILDVFNENTRKKQRQWLTEQFQRTYDPESKTMSKDNTDPATLTARLYEATRLANIKSIQLDN